MADVTIGELPRLNTMEADTLIPVEHDGEAKSMAGSVLESYVHDFVDDDVERIAEIIAVGPKGEDGADGADGVSPALSSTKSGKTTTVYYTDATHPTPTVLATLQDGADGSGIGDMLKSVYDPNERYTDIFAYCDAHGLRSATVIVAASNSKNTNSADFVCTGTADHLTIQAAINSLPNTGGRVLLMEGTYYLDCTDITPEDGVYTIISVGKMQVSIQGQGVNTILRLDDVENTVNEDEVNILKVSAGRFYISDVVIRSANSSVNATGLLFTSNMADITRVRVWDCGNAGIETSGEDVAITACAPDNCGIGLRLIGGFQRVTSCHLDNNYTGIKIEDGTHIISDCMILNNYDKGLYAAGGKRCLIKGNCLVGQSKGIEIDGATDYLITGNVVFRSRTDSSWGAAEYPIVCLNSTRPHIINNYVYGKAVSLSGNTGAVLSYSGSDWNPTV